MRSLLLCLLVVLLLGPARAAEPFFKKGDVIALVGGEDMVVASEYGYLELLLTRALPDYKLRFRNLAWEGDTVFEQRRDLNFPTYEEQLDKIGATVVIAQFGLMESVMMKRNGLDAEDGEIGKFIAAYGTLLERLSGERKRRVIVITPRQFNDGPERLQPADPLPDLVNDAIANLANRRGDTLIRTFLYGLSATEMRRDKLHYDAAGHYCSAVWLANAYLRLPAPLELGLKREQLHDIPLPPETGSLRDSKYETLRQLIIAKNRLWFDYWRPQNWAFLAGDRTAQPSSRDHLDPSKRWFPPEREAFLPLIDAKEKEIDALAAQLAAGNAGK